MSFNRKNKIMIAKTVHEIYPIEETGDMACITPHKNWRSLGRDNSFPVSFPPQKTEIIWFSKPNCSLGMILITG